MNVTLTGNSTLATYAILVANKDSVTGNSTFNNDYSSLSKGSQIRASGGVIVE